MVKTAAFDEHPEDYDLWYAENPTLYEAELEAVKYFLPPAGKGVEIGVGTGRFAAPLGVSLGVEPSSGMASVARRRGIQVVKAVAEALPFADLAFDFALMVTVDCFLENLSQAMDEAGRILKPRGSLIIGMLDRESGPGLTCSRKMAQGRFCRGAALHSVIEMELCLKGAGFGGFAYRQTMVPGEAVRYKVEEGHGKGGFVVIRAIKPGEVR